MEGFGKDLFEEILHENKRSKIDLVAMSTGGPMMSGQNLAGVKQAVRVDRLFKALHQVH